MKDQPTVKRADSFAMNLSNDDDDNLYIFSEPDRIDCIAFLVVEERPLLNKLQSSILSTTAAVTWVVGVWVNSRIGRLLLKRRSSSGRSAIDKLLLTYTVISIATYSPLLVSSSKGQLPAGRKHHERSSSV